MQISLLPETIRIDLSPVDATLWGGIFVTMRPLDVEEFMRWADAFPGIETAREAASVLIRQQIVGVEGADFAGQPVDTKNALHFRSLFSIDRKGVDALGLIYKTLTERAGLAEEAEKNSDSPSGSDTLSSLAT